MRRRFRALSLAVSGALALCACDRSPPAAAPDAADTVFKNARIYTVDAARNWAEAVAISDGKISYVGSNAGAESVIGPTTRVVDLGGRLVLPAFQDSHIHPISAGIEAEACSLNGLEGLAEYRSTIAGYAAANPELPWILGGGWSISVFGPGGAPHRSDAAISRLQPRFSQHHVILKEIAAPLRGSQ